MNAPMNATVASLTSRSLLGRKRTLVLLLLPLALLALCTLARVLAGLDPDIRRELDGALAPDLLGAFGIAILMPLLSLIAGTGSIGPEIDEGSIVYLLAKPLNRHSIIFTKLVIAIGVVIAFGVLPIAAAGVVLTSRFGTVTLAFTVGALAAGVAYCAVFLFLAVVTRNAVVIGLIYALIWESLVGGLVPGAQALSIQQWSLAIVNQLLGDSAARLDTEAAVGFGVGLVLLTLVTVVATACAGVRLQTLRLNDDA
jgi:ABC-2 type transport system permease protein